MMNESHDSKDSLCFRTKDGQFFGSEFLINGKPVERMTKLVIWADIEDNVVRWRAEFNAK